VRSALPTIFQDLATSPAKSVVGARRGHAPRLRWRCRAAFRFGRHLTRTRFFTFRERAASTAISTFVAFRSSRFLAARGRGSARPPKRKHCSPETRSRDQVVVHLRSKIDSVQAERLPPSGIPSRFRRMIGRERQDLKV